MVRIQETNFGEAPNPFNNNKLEPVRCFNLRNNDHMEVEIITLGASIRSMKVQDAGGIFDDVVLGYDDVAGYLAKENPYIGATVGRVANRVANGHFTLPGIGEVDVSRNWNNKHQLHGGFVGFDKAIWEVESINADGVTLVHCNPDGHEGYPGQVTVKVKYALFQDNSLHVRYTAETTKTTPINLTNHSYFNLAGHNAGPSALYEHSIRIEANEITETDEDSVPTGKFVDLTDNKYDLRRLSNLGERIKALEPALGFDNNYCVKLRHERTTAVAVIWHPTSGRWMEIDSNKPGLQFYTSNYMPDVERGEAPIIGKAGAKYTKHCALCLETQKYPDAVNHPNFPTTIVTPGQHYEHEMIYKFGTLVQ